MANKVDYKDPKTEKKTGNPAGENTRVNPMTKGSGQFGGVGQRTDNAQKHASKATREAIANQPRGAKPQGGGGQ